MTAADVLRQHEAELRSLQDVTGVGLGQDADGKEVIVVFVSADAEDAAAARARVPAELDGYRTDIRPEIRVFPGRDQEGGDANAD